MPVALITCFPDGPCASIDDYGAFLFLLPSHAPLYVASGCLVSTLLLRVDLGHYVKTARSLSLALVWSMLWLSLVSVESVSVALGHASNWSPPNTLVGLPSIGLVAIMVALTGDALLHPRATLTPTCGALQWLRRVSEALLISVVPPLVGHFLNVHVAFLAFCIASSLVVGLEYILENHIEWVHVGLFSLMALVLWLSSLQLYHSAYLVVFNGLLFASLLIMTAGRTRWALRERCQEKTRLTKLEPT
jgi:hypothetical protein